MPLELGKQPEQEYTTIKDAVHVAVCSVTNDWKEPLKPGQHVGFVFDPDEKESDIEDLEWKGDYRLVSPEAPNKVGIVDPFLTEDVKPYETFWLCIYPGTVTNLTHHWRHPEFNGRWTAAENPDGCRGC